MLAAAIGLVQLSKAESLRNSRQKLALQYMKRLAGLPLDLPSQARSGSVHAWHLFPMLIRESARVSRNDMIKALRPALS
jgi:dTDP-4-amino-4,6-dideoxygalactose transaminase